MTTSARNAASILRAAVLRWTVVTQRRLSYGLILCWQLYWTHWKPGRCLIAERRGDVWTGGEGERGGQTGCWLSSNSRTVSPLLTYCSQSCCWINEPVVRGSENLQVCSVRTTARPEAPCLSAFCPKWLSLTLNSVLLLYLFDSQTVTRISLTRFAGVWPLTSVFSVSNLWLFTDDSRRVNALIVAPLLCPWNLLF